MILDLFAGPGGWDEGLRRLGRRDVLGLEIDPLAIATARAAGHERERRDVSGADPTTYGDVAGIVASPPCQGLSAAGKRSGQEDLAAVYDALQCLADGHDCRAELLFTVRDHKSLLLLEPLRWLIGTGASWLVMEQVPAALPVWEWYGELLGVLDGWDVDCGVLDAADYGVPQQRRRAVFVASRVSAAQLPAPSSEQLPASIVLGPGWHGFPRRNDRPDGARYRARDIRSNELPAFTLTEKARSWHVVDVAGQQRRQLTAAEAGQLQSFPADYPWFGSRSDQFLQLANAVPPALAERVLAGVLP